MPERARPEPADGLPLSPMRLTVVLPFFDEEALLPGLPAALARIRTALAPHTVRLLAVDDGSTDGTAAGLAALAGGNFEVLTHERNRGPGAAMATGIRYATGEAVLVYDPDEAYPAGSLAPLVAALDTAAVATLSPYHPEGAVEGVGPLRLLLSRGASSLYRRVLRSRVHTFTCAVRAYRLPDAVDLLPCPDDFTAAAFLIAGALRRGWPVAEVPAVLRVRQAGGSKMRLLRTIRAHLRLLRDLSVTPAGSNGKIVTRVTVPGSGECFDLARPGAVAAWNRALNRRYGMENLRAHPSAWVRRIEERRRRRIAALVPPFERALDVGAEDGSLAGLWRARGRTTVLVDVDPAMLARADGARAVADAAALPLRAASLDVVVLSAILEHVVDPAAVVREAARLLRPGGTLVVYVPWDGAVVALKRWARRLGVRLGALAEGRAPGHLREFDRASLRDLLVPLGGRLRLGLDPLSFGWYAEVRL